MAASRASFRAAHGPGGWHRWPPKVVLNLIGCFCHKELFCVLSRSQANHQKTVLQRRTLTPTKGGGWPRRAARFTLSTPDFAFCTICPRLWTYPLWFAPARWLRTRVSLQRYRQFEINRPFRGRVLNLEFFNILFSPRDLFSKQYRPNPQGLKRRPIG